MTDVIVLAYNSQNLIQKTLFSIAYQENVKDLNVYIVNNKSKIDYSNEVKFFNQFMNIKELKITQKLSQGLARQYALEHSKSEFIMFIDPGDTFASPIATKILQKKITKEKADIVESAFYEIFNIEEKRVNELLKNSIELYDICVRYPVQSGKERQSLFYEQFYYQFNDEDRKYYLNPIISFTEFMDLIKEEI